MYVSHFLYVSYYLCTAVHWSCIPWLSVHMTDWRCCWKCWFQKRDYNLKLLAVSKLHDHRVCSEYLHLQDLAHKHAPRMLQGWMLSKLLMSCNLLWLVKSFPFPFLFARNFYFHIWDLRHKHTLWLLWGWMSRKLLMSCNLLFLVESSTLRFIGGKKMW